ncbi:FAD/NAD(P)-binding domain-containing protein [Aspergillus sclerotiicarbonarius CBS 121057]|uniref:FAD/NAD(P)-binding domain-containing protein n=1 Tax=Aspergillus sclerotiicarbonarius (strain CBS 121057 / IBT 28362) TaxID=1448318 RepID=A0A319EQZ9_ASPSB|nr:FAD/NAD(P)-binding domain-containing protein [Aspergillus sclerotiicarbonarius CBS 121057]
MSIDNVAIIGAGLSGLALALALHQQGIPCTIYEARSAPLNIGGAIMLSPNALRILDHLGVYTRILPEAYSFDHLYFRSADDTPLDTYEFGSVSKYNYQGMRIYRHILIRELSAMVHDAGILIHYQKKFSHVRAESPTDVTWEFVDGTSASATCLVGADGIHSNVRKYLYPDLEPHFTNAVGVTAAIPTSQLGLTSEPPYPLPVTILNPKHGAFVLAPQHPTGSVCLIGRQKHSPNLTRPQWTSLLTSPDKKWCLDFLRENTSSYPEIVQRAVSTIDIETINIWPFYVVPKLGSWRSEGGRVVVLGDAAHAIPPSAGQGVNQAFEDIFTFSLVVGRCGGGGNGRLARGLKVWQKGRQERVDRVLGLNAQIDRRRMPRRPGEEDVKGEEEPFELEWLYKPDFGEMVAGWLVVEGL